MRFDHRSLGPWYGESGLKSEGTAVFGSIVGELRLDSSVLCGEKLPRYDTPRSPRSPGMRILSQERKQIALIGKQTRKLVSLADGGPIHHSPMQMT
jgi:hypothetical protein